jgi:hypothetical protein
MLLFLLSFRCCTHTFFETAYKLTKHFTLHKYFSISLKLHSGELHNLYSSPDIIRQIKSKRMRWVGNVASMGEGRSVYRILVGKPEGKRPLERPRRRWEDGIKIDLREIGWGCVEWIHLAQDRDRWRAVVNAVMNFRVLAPRS